MSEFHQTSTKGYFAKAFRDIGKLRDRVVLQFG